MQFLAVKHECLLYLIPVRMFVSDKVIGKVTIGSFMFARGKELQHWNDMVASPKEQVMNWHTLVS